MPLLTLITVAGGARRRGLGEQRQRVSTRVRAAPADLRIATRLPSASIMCAAFSVSKRHCSSSMRLSAILPREGRRTLVVQSMNQRSGFELLRRYACSVAPFCASSWPKARRLFARAHSAASARSAIPIVRMQW